MLHGCLWPWPSGLKGSPRLEKDGWARACPRPLHCPRPEFPRPQLVSEVAGCRGTNVLTAPAAHTPSHSPQLKKGRTSEDGRRRNRARLGRGRGLRGS